MAVRAAVVGVRATLREARLPSAPNDQRCEKGSLLESCLPAVMVRPRRLQYYRSLLYLPGLDDAKDDAKNDSLTDQAEP